MHLPNLKQLFAKIDFKRLNPKTWDKKIVQDALRSFTAVAFCFLLFFSGYYFSQTLSGSSYESDEFMDEEEEDELCNVEWVELYGSLMTYLPPGMDDVPVTESPEVFLAIESAEKDDQIKAILVEVDSGGGSPVAGEEIEKAIKSAKKPVVAFVRDVGASAAYLGISGADWIFASKNSDIGGIGVTMSYLDYVGENQKSGLYYNSLSTGKFKDAGDPDKALTQEEKNLFMRDLNILHNQFVQTVAENRKLDVEKVKALADGSTMLGLAALENGLIDGIGGYYEALDYLKEKIGTEVVMCW